MTTPIEISAPTSLSEVHLKPRGKVYPSPADWRDQTLYFLLPDRFSDGNESQRSRFDRNHPEQWKSPDKAAWMKAGTKFSGGTLKGIESKLDYLQDLGVTALWIGPIWKQRCDLETYHGYGIQNFLEIEPRFGTRQDLRDLVDAAHERGMYVLLDIIYNHTGNNWFYQDENGHPITTRSYRYFPPHPVAGWRSQTGDCIANPQSIEDAVWPQEFQKWEWYTRAGKIEHWDSASWENVMHPDVEFRRGDFFDLKDLCLSKDEVLSAVIKVYQYWIALSDCDGFRIDTVKHLSWESSRDFCGAIREYTESIGKENFLLLGEVTGGATTAKAYLDIFGLNLDAILDIGEPPKKLMGFVKGFTNPQDFFNEYGGVDDLGSHRVVGQYHVSILDDHDMVGRDGKYRVSANNNIPARYEQTAHAVGVQLTTLGIPCIYYGTEQAFDGTDKRHDRSLEPGADLAITIDRYVREVMFGGLFGAFETSSCHFFDPNHPTYLRIAAIARLRSQKSPVGLALRRGRQYLREISIDGRSFVWPTPGQVVGWSRIQFHEEVVMALNTNGTESQSAYVAVDPNLHPPGSQMIVLYHSAWNDEQLRHPPTSEILTVELHQNRTAVYLTLPPAGMMILA